MKRFHYLLWLALLAPALAAAKTTQAAAPAKATKAKPKTKTNAAKAKAAKVTAALAAASRDDCARQAAIAADKQAVEVAARRNAGAQPTSRPAPRQTTASAQSAAGNRASGAAHLGGGQASGSALPPSRPDSATSYQPGATLRLELGVNSYGPLTYGDKNLILPFTLDFVQRFTTDNGQQPTSGLRLRAVVDPTRHRMSDSVYAAYTLLQTGRLEADADLFIEGSPIADVSLNAHGGAGLRFYPLFTQQREWHFYETYEQVLLRLGGGFAYRLRAHDSHRAWGQLAANFDYVRHWHDFASRGEAYYRRHIGSQLFFDNLQAQLRFTTYVCPKLGLELSTNWYGRPADGPETKYFDARLGVVLRFGAKGFRPMDAPVAKKQSQAQQAAAKDAQ